jgi:hypothetical protein
LKGATQQKFNSDSTDGNIKKKNARKGIQDGAKELTEKEKFHRPKSPL